MKVSVSFLKSPYSREITIEKIENSNADYIHVDLMDGKLVERKNFKTEEVLSLLKKKKKPLDIHFMTEDLEEYIDSFAILKPKYITFHIEAKCDTVKIIEKIKQYHIKVGLAINPDTPLEKIIPFLKKIDLVLIMSVKPGLGGQVFLPSTINRLKEIKKYQKEMNFMISVDGGINDNTINEVKEYVDMVVSGSFICESEDYQKQINKLKN